MINRAAMRAMRRTSESGQEPASLLALIDECASLVRPDDEVMLPWAEAYAKNHRLRLARALELAEHYLPRGAKLAEFGATPLLLTLPLQRLGYDVTGIDIDPSRFGRAIENGGLCIIKCDIEKQQIPAGNAAFDAALFNELFEHLRIDLIHTMREVHRVLKPGGLLLLSSPNLRSLQGLQNFLLRNRATSCAGDVYGEYEKLRKLGHMGHVREYTTREIVEFLDLVGFQVEHLVFRGDFGRSWMTHAARAMPGFRPYVTYVARVRVES
jgi:SAM-dependent methyltransferase